jgi:hypothetical protein
MNTLDEWKVITNQLTIELIEHRWKQDFGYWVADEIGTIFIFGDLLP